MAVVETQHMTEAQERHLKDIKDLFEEWVDSKYRAGVAEHGGNVWEQDDLELLDNAQDEAVDIFVYIATAYAKMTALKRRVLELEEANRKLRQEKQDAIWGAQR